MSAVLGCFLIADTATDAVLEYLCDEIDSAFSLVGYPEVASVMSWDVFIDTGSYKVDTQIHINVGSSVIQTHTFVLRGTGMSKTIISDTFTSELVYCDVSIADLYISVSDLMYFPMYGTDHDFLYVTQAKQLQLKNIIIDAQNSDGYSWTDMIYSYQTDSIYVDNLQVYDIDGRSGAATIFDLTYCDSIVMENVLVSTDILDDDSTVRFCYVDDTGDIYFDNITISNAYGKGLFVVYDSDFCDIYLHNIVLDNVYGGSFFYFYSNRYSDTSMSNIFVNGNDKYLYSYFLYSSYNYGSINVKNSVFSNFVLSTSSIISFYLNQAYYVCFANVSFANLTSSGSTYGLIYIYDDFNVVIDGCTFENNIGFLGLIHCRSSSYCNVIIKDSLFKSNLFADDCFGTSTYTNGVYFENNAYEH